eukprot:TRINITY_DN38883_c0_g1_i1.p1 TRINITY_DN38883_c0_g1~~TRINITY_DN38883_c0_g1_i1.p1  ORF type:complete len:1270 (+),score=205.39 TRINITY_DN38883_c0_g1_i1:501-4310(+)
MALPSPAIRASKPKRLRSLLVIAVMIFGFWLVLRAPGALSRPKHEGQGQGHLAGAAEDDEWDLEKQREKRRAESSLLLNPGGGFLNPVRSGQMLTGVEQEDGGLRERTGWRGSVEGSQEEEEGVPDDSATTASGSRTVLLRHASLPEDVEGSDDDELRSARGSRMLIGSEKTVHLHQGNAGTVVMPIPDVDADDYQSGSASIKKMEGAGSTKVVSSTEEGEEETDDHVGHGAKKSHSMFHGALSLFNTGHEDEALQEGREAESDQVRGSDEADQVRSVTGRIARFGSASEGGMHVDAVGRDSGDDTETSSDVKLMGRSSISDGTEEDALPTLGEGAAAEGNGEEGAEVADVSSSLDGSAERAGTDGGEALSWPQKHASSKRKPRGKGSHRGKAHHGKAERASKKKLSKPAKRLNKRGHGHKVPDFKKRRSSASSLTLDLSADSSDAFEQGAAGADPDSDQADEEVSISETSDGETQSVSGADEAGALNEANGGGAVGQEGDEELEKVDSELPITRKVSKWAMRDPITLGEQGEGKSHLAEGGDADGEENHDERHLAVMRQASEEEVEHLDEGPLKDSYSGREEGSRRVGKAFRGDEESDSEPGIRLPGSRLRSSEDLDEPEARTNGVIAEDEDETGRGEVRRIRRRRKSDDSIGETEGIASLGGLASLGRLKDGSGVDGLEEALPEVSTGRSEAEFEEPDKFRVQRKRHTPEEAEEADYHRHTTVVPSELGGSSHAVPRHSGSLHSLYSDQKKVRRILVSPTCASGQHLPGGLLHAGWPGAIKSPPLTWKTPALREYVESANRPACKGLVPAAEADAVLPDYSSPIRNLDDLVAAAEAGQRLLVIAPRFGLGNSLRSFASAWTFALLSSRRIVFLNAGDHYGVYITFCKAFKCGFDHISPYPVDGPWEDTESAEGEPPIMDPHVLYKKFIARVKPVRVEQNDVNKNVKGLWRTEPVLFTRNYAMWDSFYKGNRGLLRCVVQACGCKDNSCVHTRAMSALIGDGPTIALEQTIRDVLWVTRKKRRVLPSVQRALEEDEEGLGGGGRTGLWGTERWKDTELATGPGLNLRFDFGVHIRTRPAALESAHPCGVGDRTCMAKSDSLKRRTLAEFSNPDMWCCVGAYIQEVAIHLRRREESLRQGVSLADVMGKEWVVNETSGLGRRLSIFLAIDNEEIRPEMVKYLRLYGDVYYNGGAVAHTAVASAGSQGRLPTMAEFFLLSKAGTALELSHQLSTFSQISVLIGNGTLVTLPSDPQKCWRIGAKPQHNVAD